MNRVLSRSILTMALFELRENIRNKWLLFYGLSFFIFSALMTHLGASDPMRASASLMNLILLIVPLFSLVFGSISFLESLPFQEVLVSMPISRADIYFGKWLGLSLGLSLAYVSGMTLGSLLFLRVNSGGMASYILTIALGVALTFIFLSLSFLIASLLKKKELVFGAILLAWFFFFLLYDVLFIGIVILLGDYPLEHTTLALVFANPIDLARVVLTLEMDLAAMMGYSGALFQKYLGSGLGIAIASLGLALWVALPCWFGFRAFEKRDL